MDTKARYLHLVTRQTPMEIPFEHTRTVFKGSYPRQDQEWINQKFYLTFRDLNVIHTIYDPFEEKEQRQRVFTCIRWDDEAPNRCVFISEDYEYLVFGIIDKKYPFSVDVYNDVDGYEYTVRIINAIYETVPAYPVQDIDIIGLKGTIQYGYIFNDRMLREDDPPQNAIILMSALNEPLSDIFITIDDENTYKVYDGSEVWFKIDDEFVPPEELINVPSAQKIVKYREYYFRGRVPYGISEN